jgi:hypothetical protein
MKNYFWRFGNSQKIFHVIALKLKLNKIKDFGLKNNKFEHVFIQVLRLRQMIR